MADQTGSGAVAGISPEAGVLAVGEHAHEAFHGRAVSWVAVSIIMVGFLVGGMGLVLHNWPLLWAGGGMVVVGGLLALGTGILNDWY